MNDVEKIIERIREGECLTIACSRYEEMINYKNGKFISTFEDGVNETFKVRNESYVRSNIVRALNAPIYYDMYIGDEDLIHSNMGD